MRFKIAIQSNRNMPGNSSSDLWGSCLEEAGHEVCWVDVTRSDFFDRLKGCHGFMWWLCQYSNSRQIARRIFPVLEHELNLPVYPDRRTGWHYDDKIAQAYLFKALDIPTPKTWVFFDREEALAWAEETEYPFVLKLWSGAGSNNVKRVKNRAEARMDIERLFDSGVYGIREKDPGILATPGKRVKVALKCLLGRLTVPPLNEKAWDLHKNYLYAQEFVKENDYDTRITVIGRRAFGFIRYNRPGNFRASGSGRLDRDPEKVHPEALRLAIETSAKLGAQSLAFDFLKQEGRFVIVEISFVYLGKAVRDCPGHWTWTRSDGSDVTWVEGHMWPEEAQVADFLERLEHHYA